MKQNMNVYRKYTDIFLTYGRKTLLFLLLIAGTCEAWGQTEISSLSDITDPEGNYTLSSTFSTTGDRASTANGEIGSAGNPFKGTIDGQLVTITGTWDKPLFDYVENATIKNVIIETASVTGTACVGAIAGTAEGATRIYNCGILSGSVGSTGGATDNPKTDNACGGLVGLLEGTARVINCYSYATITGGNRVAGIVGYNNVKTTAAMIGEGNGTMVMNCMFYGDITEGNRVSPVYGGENINNLNSGGLNTFNYYAYDKLKTKSISGESFYNCALAVEERYLTRFEFYRQLLNSNKKLAAFYVTGSKDNANQMAKWVLETADRSIANPKPYPVLKAQGKYPSIINYDVTNAPDSATVGRNHGGKLGKKLTVHLSGTGITTTSLTLQRTDKDFDRFNFNYDKIQLPYFNDVGTGNYINNQVVTGWKITGITDIDGDPYTSSNYPKTGVTDYPNHNYADRKSSKKDLYSVSGRVFSQGAYFDVPYGVTDIYIEPYWGKAAYVADEYLDVVCNTSYSGQSVTQLGRQYGTNEVNASINGSTQKVYTSIANALNNLSGVTNPTVYDYAVVLVGNLHQSSVPSNGTKPFTLMSIDLDKDNEPDYSYIYNHGARDKVSPIRFDFLNIPGTAQAQKPNGASNIRNAAVFKTLGWFEITNTALMYFSQFEYENKQGNVTKTESPIILHGGVFDQFVSTQNQAVDGKTIYVHVGGNVWMKSLALGTHGDGSYSTPHVPISVTGGDIEGLYLTGTYNQNAGVSGGVKDDNAECYISGGRFQEVAGAGQEQLGVSANKGNVHWQIYDADIEEFYGGGINDAKPIKGNIVTDIFNSHVTTFCGGPKFGNMQAGKTVTTNAEGCVFDKYFGAGYGGVSYNRQKYTDHTSYNFTTLAGKYTTDKGKYFDAKTDELRSADDKQSYGYKGPGVATDFDYEFFVWNSGATGARFYVKFASFSLAQCNDVESYLKSCTINNSFYGGGSRGKVTGTATSVLDGCTVNGNVFGGGYSADLPKIPVRTGGFTKNPNYNKASGMFEPGVKTGTTDYEWTHVDTYPNNGEDGTPDDNKVITTVNLDVLGQVGATDLTIKGNTHVSGNVFGGGDESTIKSNATTGATGSTKVTIEKNDNNESPTITNVYGGGNTADVDGNTEVVMTSGTVSNDIFGGGKGKNTVVAGDVKVNIGKKNESTGALSGTGTIRNVYGGSAFGAINASATKDSDGNVTAYTPSTGKTAIVNIYGCTSIDSIFGGGLGSVAENIAAKNYGDVTMTIEGGNVKKAIFGGSDANGVLKKNSTVTITGGTVGTLPQEDNPKNDVVFGGGYGQPTLVEGNVEVNIGTSGQSTAGATINGHVYGGGALGNVNASKPESTLVFDATKKVDINLFKGTVNGDVYGGGLGNTETAAYVGGDVTVTLDGAKIPGSIFGCNNLNGTPKGHVKVWVKRTVDSDKSSSEALAKTREQRTFYDYDVEAIYGGGNKADYVPTNATIVLPDADADNYKADSTKLADARAEVLIEGCEKTSINHVYGGGNAAAVPATDVTIKGSYIINTVYGGGNGEGEGNPGANIGIYKLNDTPTNYGTGKAVTKLLGGYINNVYGGSNTKGDVRGGVYVNTKKFGDDVDGDCCTELKAGKIYGAGSQADVNSDVNVVLECMPEDYVDAVYGGAEKAIVNGNVELTVTSGKFGRVFGGNNAGGDIRGSITVNVYEDGCKPLMIGELYGGGNQAPYSVFGCDKIDENTWTAKVSGDSCFNEAKAGRAAIQVNVIASTSIGKVFGGGNQAEVIGNTHVWINQMKGLIDGEKQDTIGKIGQVFGGGNAARVKGNTRLDIGTSLASEPNGVKIISGNDYLSPTGNAYINITEAGIYGGGYSADVDGDVTLNIGTANLPLGTNITGNIFGGGYGEKTTITGNVVVNIGSKTDDETPVCSGYAVITGDVYGGSAKGKVNATKSGSEDSPTFAVNDGKTTQVNLYGGTIKGNAYGGGLGDGDHTADVYGPVTVNVEGITMKVEEAAGVVTKGQVFGGNNVKGSPKGTTTVLVKSTNAYTYGEGETEYAYHIANVFGGGNQAAFNGTSTSVQMSGSTVNNVFGGGLGTTATVSANTTVDISGGSVINNVYGGGSEAPTNGSTSITLRDSAAVGNDVYGGGSLADVQGAVVVNLNGGTVARDVYGGGALARTNTSYDSSEHPTYITAVNLGNSTVGTSITGNLYGGGLGDGDHAADVNGPVTVTVTKGLATNVFGCNNINGSPLSTVTVNINGTNAPTFERALPIRNVYGGGNQAAYTYADANNPQNLKVNITGGTMDNVFGGGLSADVAGGIDVKVSGGTIASDVYGGGALANTNTANTLEASGSNANHYFEVKHLKYVEDQKQGEEDKASDVSEYYEDSAGNTLTSDVKAQKSKTYYKQISLSEKTYREATTGTTYKTIVTLTGGTIGNAYGGGLGQLANGNDPQAEGYLPDVEAMVYGDVEITVGDGTGTAAFTDDVEYISGGSENVPKHGRVFGCNNLNGTPKGKVTVTINSTKRTDGTSNHVKGEFEIQGVYGGGNLSHYVPTWFDSDTEFGQHTKVIVNGCSNTSINKVYGGGNAADVPFTDVEIDGAFEIGYVFGGGNGGDKINKGSGWVTNPGANVTHYANVMLRGGTIGQAFGGSDTRGNVGGADVKQETSADCPLRIVNLYGAGNGDEANSDGDINIEVSACGEGSEIQNVFGGSYKANIKGSVTLTIKSGIFTSVYGGNDRMGSIGGNITVNIEETDNCSKPIIIQNLYGGCYQTAYPGEGAKTYKGDPYPKDQEDSYTPFTSGKITVNVRSATRIDRIYGGSENGAVTGDTEVNINMVRGSQSGQTGVALPSYYGEAGASIPSNITVTGTNGYVEVHGLVTVANTDPTKTPSSVVGYFTRSGESEPYTYTAATGLAQENTTYYKKAVIGNIAEGIGTIGEVFGGGNKGNVSGDATVNIVTDETVTMADASTPTVLGAKITGNVYGGGNLADVKRNTYVNICVKDNQALSDGAEHVTIGGNIYGGGKGADDTFECEKGMVGQVNTNDGTHAGDDFGTHVRIGNGTIGNGTTGGDVYGGGEIGRVEFHSVVTIGLPPKAGVATSAPEILGNVFGGGKGVETHGYSALLRGNATVTVQQNAKVRNCVYGGGEISTTGRFYVKNVNDSGFGDKDNPKYKDVPTGMPYALRDGGKCTVNILDSVEIGPTAIMAMPQFTGNVFGAGKGILPKVYDYSAEDDDHKPRRISAGNIKDYFKDVDAYMFFIETLALVDETHVTIGDNAFVKGSVYGGSENGRVLNDTHVLIAGGQIGWGKNARGTNGRHSDDVWAAGYTPLTNLECPSWEYTSPYTPYDPFAKTDGTYDYSLSNFSVIPQTDRISSSEGGRPTGTDGHTYYGNVYGGGSGKDPYAPGKWHRKAGYVGGDSKLIITGGHILTNIYGGNEHTDVNGDAYVMMIGGTLGVPRTVDRMKAHPVTCYLFGAGKGDQRIFFNTWTNVQNAIVHVSDSARIYGSIFGGGEDGHVLKDATVTIGSATKPAGLATDPAISALTLVGSTVGTINYPYIGTTGTSYVDGNIFGGGRGFSGTALTAGSVGSNIAVTIAGGTMLGSIYGGGRLASVGIDFTPASDPSYGQLVDDTDEDNDGTIEDSERHGHITLNISGGTIGTTTEEGHPVGGNVFGGSMGRITLLDGTLNRLWPKQAVAKLTNITISGGEIKNNVYGGSEYGIVRNQTTVNMTAGTVHGNVFGGGYGSDDQRKTTITAGGYASIPTMYYTFTPMQWTGCVSGNTFVNISGGTVGKNVYGGGDMASVGLINFNSNEDGTVYNYITKHDDPANGFALSWPYKFEYIAAAPNDDQTISGGAAGGKATVNITGTANITGYVYGASKGKVAFNTIDSIAEQRYTEAFIANVKETEVTIGTSGGSDNPQIRTVYGGGEDGHVMENAKVIIHCGTITNSVFGGGKGTSKFNTKLWDTANPGNSKATTDSVYSWTAGKVYGNTSVTMNGGSVGYFIYGGGNMASVGKGNYAGGSDDYSTAGYGELPSGDGKLWTDTCFTNSGHSTVTIMGGNVGPTSGTSADADGIPHGSVFGGSRGKAAKTITQSPRYRYGPDFFLGYVNKATINIGGYIKDEATTLATGDGPTIYGSIYGGGQDGHVRNSTEVRIFKGSITGQGDYRSGNVFGAGSGIGTYKDGDNNYCNNASGSVTCATLVEVSGGSIAGNVYGGGALASVGPPKIGQPKNEQKTASDNHASYSHNLVNIKGGSIDGSVFGASRGPAAAFLGSAFTNGVSTTETGPTYYNPTRYATSIWTEVNVTGGTIRDNVYGGGEMGQVKENTVVNLTGGTITHDAYGGGQGTRGTNAIAADVGGSTTVELNKGVTTKGCIVDKVFGCNDLNGTPKGHVLVHVYATQKAGQESVSDKANLPPSYSADKTSEEGYIEFMQNLITQATKPGGLASDTIVITSAQATISGKIEANLTDIEKTAILNAAKNIDIAMNGLYDSYGYDVTAVYGGGDLAPYEPANDEDKTEVIIEGCGVTSIKQVYGGGNAASVSATDVTVKSCYIIGELFGGGNGKDNYKIGTTWYENPGANVGYRQMSHYVESGETGYNSETHGTGAEGTPYKAIENTDATTPEERRANYTYGTGVATSTINGGHIHKAYGGSNEKGNISGEIASQLQQVGTCTIVTDGTYGGSKSADTDATINVTLDCVENGGTFYGGSYKANINSDVNIHITNGTYAKIFGGNDRAGTINGKITITIEEYGCTPINITELYAGGNLAPYSVYGYKTETEDAKDENGNTYQEGGVNVQQRIPYRAGEIGARTTPYWDPRINIISATSIGAIYGGGYGATATMIGNPHINVNMTKGRIRAKYADYKSEYESLESATDGDKYLPIGTIGTIYGGGNLASVEGDTYVEIGTGQWIASWDASGNPVWESTNASGDKYSYKEKTPAVYYSQAECNEHNDDLEGYIASGTTLTTEQVTAVKAALGTNYVAGAELTTKDANAYNATLSGARKTSDIKETIYYTQSECDEYNATLDGAHDNTDPSTAAEANAYNANLAGARKTTDVKAYVYYTQAECDEYNSTPANGVTGYIAKHTKLSADSATLVNNALTPSYQENDPITEADANAYNATLDGALKTTDVKVEAVWAWYSGDEELTTPPTLAPRNTAKITGDVYGGGKGEAKEDEVAGAFTCAKGMIGVDGDGIDYPEGGTNVTIGNGVVTIGGSVYGGGEIGRVEKNTSVTIGLGDGTGTAEYPVITGNVFGAGKGKATHGYSALVRGNSTVTIQGDTKVRGSVYGGGEISSVGRYNVDPSTGIPTSLKNPNSGNCIVTIQGYAEIGPDDMKMTAAGGPDDYGHVFGAGMGASPYVGVDGKPWVGDPWRMTISNTKDIFNTATYSNNKETKYLSYLETLGLATHTDVTIGGNAFVKGSVYGGAENGYVQHDTHVTIKDSCQIGNGYVQMNDDGTYLAAGNQYSLNRRYTATEWANGRLYKDGETNYQHSLPECASWEYKAPYAAHDSCASADIGFEDKYSDHTTSTEGGRRIASDGHTFYGNVFGGGSGYYPYAEGKWHKAAGSVGGNTLVEIKGGHILTNVYGGNEMTNVTGSCTINMSGGTLGVPRTLGQIVNHPVTCYLFGAGKGDPRIFFNKDTNVENVEVEITGGTIYGSVFGGGEDGHVLSDVTMTIGNEGNHTGPKIGTLGTSYVDGNVFGAGRGFEGDAYTAGSVGGNVMLNIHGGEMLGSVYGGGRLASVGSYFVPAGHAKYGQLVPDGYKQNLDSNAADPIESASGVTHGHVTLNITGGTIGNDAEFAYNPSASTISNTGSLRFTVFENYSFKEKSDYDAEKNTMKQTGDAVTINKVKHTKGGNVFAGGMGRRMKMDNVTPMEDSWWPKLGQVKSTKLTMTGGTIKGNVYGGGEMGSVTGYHTTKNAKNEDVNVGTEVIISGGTIGTEVQKDSVTQYTFGSVYGGGMGLVYQDNSNWVLNGGNVSDSTSVKISGENTRVWANVYGGGEMGIVNGNTDVTINNGKIGKSTVRNDGYVLFGSYLMGNVYGAGEGTINHVNAGLVKTNTHVSINGGEIYHNVYGGGALASVGTFSTSTGTDGDAYVPAGIPLHWTSGGTSTVTINGGTIGVSGRDNGMVCGSSRGDIEKPSGTPAIDRYDKLAWVKDAIVTIGEATGNSAGPHIKGSVYGGGENGHNSGNATVTVNRGTIGVVDTDDPWYSFNNDSIDKKALITRGNIYGAGCGTDTYTDGGKEYHNPKTGVVCGNTFVNIAGGHIGHSVYGAGSMGSVGTITNAADTITGGSAKHSDEANSFALSWPYKFEFAANTGKATVNITGGHIGTQNIDGGDVFGSSRGEAGDRYATAHLAYVKETEVNVNYVNPATEADIPNIETNYSIPCVTGSVHGSGEDGYVYGDAHVTINKGLVGHSVYGAGKGKGTYKVTLAKIVGDGNYDANIYSLISGKVMGNTYVTMNGGLVGRNVYGGGNMASVGKGNYAGGNDDYSTSGYGETVTGSLWTSATTGDDAWQFLNSGKATVKVFGGQVGVISTEVKNNLPYGNVFGGSAGEAAPNVPVNLTPRYHYSPAFFSGYVNETDVTIGGYRCNTAYGTYKVGDCITAAEYNALASGNKANWEQVGPTIIASVYGGGQDGHVRRDTKVTVNSGEIGLAYNATNQGKLGTTNLDDPQWLHRGNIYGAGSGISEYEFDFDNNNIIEGNVTIGGKDYPEKDFSTSAGSVTRFTEVNVLGGTIHRNVYGGGSMGSVGAPRIGQDYDQFKRNDNDTATKGKQSQCTVNIGGGTGITAIGTPTEYKAHYGGEVYGASRGLSPENALGSVIWTLVKILNGANVQGNVFGGGDAGMVKKDSEVIIGEEKVTP